MIRAVFFDAGETLVYPHPSFAELFAEVVRRMGHPIDPAVVHEALSAFSKRFTEALQKGDNRLWSTSRKRSRAFWFRLYGEFLGEVGVDDPRGEVSEALYAQFTDLSSYRLHPDAVPVLDRLRAGGLTLGVVSNFEDWLEQLLDTLGVAAYFPVRVISGAEGVEKPDPKIFHIALERAGVEPAESVYVGDHPYFDVEPAAEVGMLPVLIDRRGHYPHADCIRITSLQDLPEAVGIPV